MVFGNRELYPPKDSPIVRALPFVEKGRTLYQISSTEIGYYEVTILETAPEVDPWFRG